MKTKYRYPGSRPFQEDDLELFFGRDTDILKLTELIVLEKLVVLFSKSGYGKSSLLNAGVIPKLREEENHLVFKIRLNEFKSSPSELLLRQLEGTDAAASSLASKLNVETEIPGDFAARLWFLVKLIQTANPKKEAITLIFDQLEELSKFPDAQMEAFGDVLATLLRQNCPKELRALIKSKTDTNPDYFTDAELTGLFEPLNLKVVFSLRFDRLGLLNKLKRYLPAILKHTYELKPLDEKQALAALTMPAALPGTGKKEVGYASPPFTYTEKAIKRILGSLKDEKNSRIETFQLQLIGQHAEECIIRSSRKNPQATRFELTETDLGNPEDIFENHYKLIMDGITPGNRRKKAIYLVENLLISQGSRIPLPESFITATHGIPGDILEQLLDKRLLRSELNSVGGTSYELSHDTLVGPIEKTAKDRRQRKFRVYLLTGIVAAIIITTGFASWGIIEMNRADKLEEINKQQLAEIDSLKAIISSLEKDKRALADTNEELREELEGIIVTIDQKPPDNNKAVNAIVGIVNPTNRISADDSISKVSTSLEYKTWLGRLTNLKAKLIEKPDLKLTKVLEYANPSDTRKLDEWDFNSQDVQIIAIRRNPLLPRIFDQTRDEALFILLVNGRVFKFLGTTGPFFTDAGHGKNKKDAINAAFLANGQHKYRMGNVDNYRALLPLNNGVLLFRDYNEDNLLTDDDVARGLDPEPNDDVFIQWYGTGKANFYTGAQLVIGQNYINPSGRIINCAPFTANSKQGKDELEISKGAYGIFVDLIWAQSENRTVYYTLLDETYFDVSAQQEIDKAFYLLKTGKK